jgi:hypothetical protein
MATIAYLDQRHEARSAVVMTPYNPYRLVGYPGIILTKYFATLVGTLSSTDTQISADGSAVQTLTFTHIRAYNINLIDSKGNTLPIDTSNPDNLHLYKPSSTFSFMDDNFASAPPWYKDFTGSTALLDKFFLAATGISDASVFTRFKIDNFNTAAAELKKKYLEAQLLGTESSFIRKTTMRMLATLDDVMATWNTKLRELQTDPVWSGTPNKDTILATPWIKQRRKRVLEVFDIVGTAASRLMENQKTKVK